MLETKVAESQPSRFLSAPKINNFQGTSLCMFTINLAKMYKLVFEIFCLQEMITHRHRQTDMTEYMTSRPSTAGSP